MNFYRHLARWILAHPKSILSLAVLGFVAFCGWNAWAAFQPNYSWAERDADKFVLEDRMDRTSVMLAGLVAWIYLSTVVVCGKLKSMKWSRWASINFNARVRERIVRGVPIGRGVLLAYAMFGLLGLVLGLALTGQALSLLPWVGSATANVYDHLVSAPLVAVLGGISAVRLLWQILVQSDWDHFAGDRRAQIAVELLRAEQAESEEEREEERTSVSGGSWAILIVGIASTAFLSSRLPESEQGLVILSGMAGLVAASLAVYVAWTQPRGTAGWLALVMFLFAGALVYAWYAFDHPTARSLLLGVAGGITIGTMFTGLHLRKLHHGTR